MALGNLAGRIGHRVGWFSCVLLFLSAVAPTAWAVDDGQQFKSWTARCGETPEGQKQCMLTQVVMDADSGKPAMQIAVGYTPNDGKAVAEITVPLGVTLPFGVGIAVDENEVTRIPYERCFDVGCIAAFPMTDKVLAAFKRGLNGQIVVHDGKRQRVLTVSLSGFTAGFGSLR